MNTVKWRLSLMKVARLTSLATRGSSLVECTHVQLMFKTFLFYPFLFSCFPFSFSHSAPAL